MLANREVTLRLSKRLNVLDSLINHQYAEIWDGCCDHGLLGATLLTRHAADIIHFVDIVPELMTQLEQKLLTYYPTQDTALSSKHSLWRVHCHDMAQLQLKASSKRQLIILSGIGGDLMSHIISQIKVNNPTHYIDFLLCPVNNSYYLREQLIALNCELYQEVLVEENHRFYEVIYVSGGQHRHSVQNTNVQATLTNVGHSIWYDANGEPNLSAIRYYKKLINHYKNMTISNPDAIEILNQYRSLNLGNITTA
jgi:tRNA (adenine22-N1)-methyltransferase